jgi:predicted nucleic acid-binding protein
VTRIVIDVSAGVELVADTARGCLLRALIPTDAVPWVPELFFSECGAVLRRWDLNGILTNRQAADSIKELMAWPLRVAQIRGLVPDAWRLGGNLTFADAIYVALAEHLGASLLTDDQRRANAPRLPVATLRLP